MNAELHEPVRRVIQLLVEGRYGELETLTKGVRVAGQDMARVIDEYGCRLVLPPEEAYGDMNVIEVAGARPRRWSVVIQLWTQEEGCSDLSVELTVIRRGPHTFDIEFDDMRVR